MVSIKGLKRSRPEHDQQSAFFEWLRLHQAKHAELKRFFAIPNGGARSHGMAIALYLEGVRAGVLDTHLPLPRQGKAGLWIEFKAGTNGLSDHQREWTAALEAEGHAVYVVYEWTAAARITAWYLGLELAIPAAPAAVVQGKRKRAS